MKYYLRQGGLSPKLKHWFKLDLGDKPKKKTFAPHHEAMTSVNKGARILLRRNIVKLFNHQLRFFFFFLNFQICYEAKFG
jgi:hypothetical protein